MDLYNEYKKLGLANDAATSQLQEDKDTIIAIIEMLLHDKTINSSSKIRIASLLQQPLH